MSEGDSSNTSSPPRRPWYRLHRSTWLLVPLPLAIAVVTVVPGEVGTYPSLHSHQHSHHENAAIVHGWPMPYLWRSPFGWRDDPAISPAALAWNLTDSVRQFDWLPMAIDLAVALAGIVAFVALMEWRRRRRGRFFQFTLRELLLGTTVVAIFFAWWSHRRGADAELDKHLTRITTKSWKTEPDFPLWVRNIVGDEFLSRLGVARPRDPGYLFWSVSCSEDVQFVVERFPKETTVVVRGPLSDDDIAGIARLDHLENLETQQLDLASGNRLFAIGEKFRNLRYLLPNNGDLTPIDDATLTHIAHMPQLEVLRIGNGGQLTERALGELRKLKRLNDLEVDRLSLTPATLNLFAELTQLRRLGLGFSTTTDADLSILTRISGLEELGITGLNLGDNGLRRLQPLRQLHYLGLCGVQVTAAGLRAMVTPSDGCPRPFQNLRAIDFQGVKLADVSILAALDTLDELTVSAHDINDDGIAALQKLATLRRLDVSGEPGSGLPLHAIEARLKRALPDCKINFW